MENVDVGNSPATVCITKTATSGYIQEVGASTPVKLSNCKLFIVGENGEYKEVGNCDFIPPGIRPINFHQYSCDGYEMKTLVSESAGTITYVATPE